MSNLDKYLKIVREQAEKMKKDVNNSRIVIELKQIIDEAKEEVRKEMKEDQDYKCVKSFFDTTSMPTNVIDKNDCIVFKVSLPGCKKENMATQIEENELVVTVLNMNSDEDCIIKEIETTNYTRKYKLADNLEKEASATYENGILTITIKKKIPSVKKIVIE